MLHRPVILVGKNNGVGLSADAEILGEILGKDRAVLFRGNRDIPCIKPLPGSIRMRDAVVIFIERVHALWLPFGGKRALMPNQERFPKRQIWRLRFIDTVLCKSHQAREIFSEYHSNAVYTGFTSRDHFDASVAHDYNQAFHLAGKSTFKGTDILLRAWEKHPEWPLLTVVAHENSRWQTCNAGNIRLIKKTLPETDLIRLQNSCGLHLCPSYAEGWGHYIAEGASCGAMVLTTDAPPMNEIITEERGGLIRVECTGCRHLGSMFQATESSLEKSIDRMLELGIAERSAYGLKAREWFSMNKPAFAERLATAINALD